MRRARPARGRPLAAMYHHGSAMSIGATPFLKSVHLPGVYLGLVCLPGMNTGGLPGTYTPSTQKPGMTCFSVHCAGARWRGEGERWE